MMSMSDAKSPPEPSMDEILASIRRILAEDEQPVLREPLRARPASDILDLTEALNDDGTVRHIAPARPATPEASSPRLSGGRIEPAPPSPKGAGEESRLISEAASAAISDSFARLQNMPRRDGGEPVLDELVRETLRPLLQAWLDKNLPELVERLVRAEVARVVGNRPVAP